MDSGAFSFGEINSLEFTNNVVYNSVFLGRPLSGQDTLEDARFAVMIDTFDASKNINIAYNNFHLDSALVAGTPVVDVIGDNIVSMEDFVFSLPVQAAIDAAGTGATNIDEALNFTNPAPAPLQFLMAVHQDTSSGSEVPEALPFDFSNLTADPIYSAIGTGMITRYSEVHDYTYNDDAVSATAGSEGQALGANFDQSSTSVGDVFVTKNILYYPNPVRDNLFIQNLDNQDLHRITVTDMTGKILIDRRAINNAIHQVNLQGMAPGVYVLSIIDERGKMDSRKIMKR